MNVIPTLGGICRVASPPIKSKASEGGGNSAILSLDNYPMNLSNQIPPPIRAIVNPRKLDRNFPPASGMIGKSSPQLW